jgi:hypothetical protein
MKIFTLWHEGDLGDAPWIVDAVDEYTVEDCEFPPEYAKKRAMPEHRELIIDVPEKVVRALFESPGVIAKVVES